MWAEGEGGAWRRIGEKGGVRGGSQGKRDVCWDEGLWGAKDAAADLGKKKRKSPGRLLTSRSETDKVRREEGAG